jgi:hypothetical protein
VDAFLGGFILLAGFFLLGPFLHQGGRKPVHIKMTMFGLYLIRYQPHLTILSHFDLMKSQKFEIEPVI